MTNSALVNAGPSPRSWHPIWRLTTPYFNSEDKWRARGLLAAIVALNLASVFMLVQLNDWNRVFYDALQNKDAAVYWAQLGRFTYLAFAFMVIAVYKFYLTQLLELRWRTWMTRHYMTRWLTHQAFYRLELARFGPGGAGQANPAPAPDNPDQRIQEDANQFTSMSVGLSMGLLNATVTLLSFVGILWGLSGSFAFSVGGSSFEIPGFMVWAAVLYCLAGSVISHLIGQRLTGLNFKQQRLEADFRHHLVRVREHSEAIALDGGAAVENRALDLRFSSAMANYLQLLKTQKNLTWFTSGFGQAAVIFPFLVAAPRFFSGAIQLGELMQIASAFGNVQGSLSWFVDNYPNLAAWKATTDRLTSFDEKLKQIEAENRAGSPQAATENIAISGPDLSAQPASSPGAQPAAARGGLQISEGAELDATGLHVRLPNGQLLLNPAHLHLAPGQHTLLQGPSGSGKSSLFRSLAGIWPFASGRVQKPANAMFLPQRPYFPQGPLREALAYPEPPDRYTDAQLRQALVDALLPQLADRLDESAAWGQQLSGGEQQRLAIARVFLKEPNWVFADEATSALDAAAEQTLYSRLIGRLSQAGRPQGTLVSIAHRESVAAFHGQRWSLEAQPGGANARFALAVHGASLPQG